MDNIITNNDFILDDFNPKVVASKMAQGMTSLRLEQNITQVDLAKKSGVSLGSIKRFESKHEISLKHLLQVALVLGVLENFKTIAIKANIKSFDEMISKKKRKRARNV